MEATGSYWVALAVHLHETGYMVAPVNSSHVHHSAASLPHRAKTDILDAVVLVPYAYDCRPDSWTPPPDVSHELRQRLVTREPLVTMRQHARNQRHAIEQWTVTVDGVLEPLDEVIADLTTRITALDKDVARVLRDNAWAATVTSLLSIPGVGILTTAWILIATLNCARGEGSESLATYAGLVPMIYQSGTSVRRRARIGPGGNSRLRRVVYLAGVVACQHNPVLKAYDERLRAAGKPNKVARCAVARKLVHLAWAIGLKAAPL